MHLKGFFKVLQNGFLYKQTHVCLYLLIYCSFSNKCLWGLFDFETVKWETYWIRWLKTGRCLFQKKKKKKKSLIKSSKISFILGYGQIPSKRYILMFDGWWVWYDGALIIAQSIFQRCASGVWLLSGLLHYIYIISAGYSVCTYSYIVKNSF